MNGETRQLTILDILNVLSFFIGIENLNANLDQNDKQDLQRNLSEATDKLLAEVHAHLERQDKKIDEILRRLEEKS